MCPTFTVKADCAVQPQESRVSSPGLLPISFFPWAPWQGGSTHRALTTSCLCPCPHLRVGCRWLLARAGPHSAFLLPS